MFGNDREGVEPELLCQPCARLIEKINKDYRNDQKYKKDNYSDEENIKENVKKTENESDKFRVKSEFKPHEENNCIVCENTSTQTNETPTKKPQEKTHNYRRI